MQFYAPGTPVHYYHIMLNFCQVNSVFRGYFLGLCFLKSLFFFLGGGGILLVAKYFSGSSEIPNSADSCLNVYQVHSP